LERDALAKTFQFDSFRAALAFMVRAGFEAEELNHHPEWTNVYHRVSVRLNTHDAGARVTITGTREGPGDYDHDLTRFAYRQCRMTDGDEIQTLTRQVGLLAEREGEGE
jgi:hypothetical protein